MNHQSGISFLSQDAMPICERDLSVTMAAPMPFTEFEQVCDLSTTPMMVTVPDAALSKTQIPWSLKMKLKVSTGIPYCTIMVSNFWKGP